MRWWPYALAVNISIKYYGNLVLLLSRSLPQLTNIKVISLHQQQLVWFGVKALPCSLSNNYMMYCTL